MKGITSVTHLLPVKHCTYVRRAGLVFMASLLTILAIIPQPAYGITPSALESINSGWGWYDPTTECLNETSVVNAAFTEGTPLQVSNSQLANAKIVMGIAKTYNLGEKGALIGLITGMQESGGLKLYANSGIPISMENPAWKALQKPGRPPYALGNDHDSVGIMQQRVSTGWSTNGNSATKEVVWQLMDPAYSAQAFFGTPKGAKLPDGLKQPTALQKGLQNVSGWETMEPGKAAQAVQISAFPGAYTKHIPKAQEMLKKYWATVPAVPLPIPITGGATPSASASGAGNETADGSCASTASVGKSGDKNAVIQKILEFAWPEYCGPGSRGCDAMKMKSEYVKAMDRAKYTGSCNGVDCGAFVTAVMRESGADPNYNKGNGNTLTQMNYLRDNSGPGKKYLRVTDLKNLESGDIAVQNNNELGHTFFYVGKITLPDGTAFKGDSASASQCERAPMAGPTDTPSKYEWYRLNSPGEGAVAT